MMVTVMDFCRYRSHSHFQGQSLYQVSRMKVATQTSHPGVLLKAPEHKHRIVSQCSDKVIQKIQRFLTLSFFAISLHIFIHNV